MKRHCAANQTVIQIEKTLTDNTDTGAVPRWYDTTAHYQTYVTGQIFKQLHDKSFLLHVVISFLDTASYDTDENILKYFIYRL